MEKQKTLPDPLPLYITFNQTFTLIAVGTETGFSIYDTYPLKLTYTHFLIGGIRLIDLISLNDIICLVGGGKKPAFPRNTLIIWNMTTESVEKELILEEEIENVKMKHNKIYIVTQSKIYIYEFDNNEQCQTIITYANPRGIFAYAMDANKYIIAYPAENKPGSVTIKYTNENVVHSGFEVCGINERTINAHEGTIFCLAMNEDGSLLATASKKGTLIRIFSTKDGNKIQEVRRGSDQCEINCIVFHSENKYLACYSDKGTFHLFKLNYSNDTSSIKNKRSFLGKFTEIVGIKHDYLSSEWSFAQFLVPESSKKAICAFGPANTVIIVTEEGIYYQVEYEYDVTEKVQCNKILNVRLSDVKEEGEDDW